MANSYQFDPKWQKRNESKGQPFKLIALPGAFLGYDNLLNRMKDLRDKSRSKDDKSICSASDDNGI